MWLTEAIPHLALMGVVALTAWYVFTYSPLRRHQRTTPEGLVLRFPLGHLFIGIFSVAYGSLATLWAAYAGEAVISALIQAGTGLLVFGTGVKLILDSWQRLVVGPHGFRITYLWRSDVYIAWPTVVAVHYAPVGEWFRIDTATESVRIPTRYALFSVFLEEMSLNVSERLWESAAAQYDLSEKRVERYQLT